MRKSVRLHDKGIAKQHFVEFNGQPVKSVKTAFKTAESLSKLEGKVSPHTLRHTAATWLMLIGVSTWDAAGFLGMSEKTLRDVYGHHHPDYLQGAAKAIGTKKPISLVIPLVKLRQRRALSPQAIENVGQSNPSPDPFSLLTGKRTGNLVGAAQFVRFRKLTGE